jgi:hypothetical protein
MIHHRVIMPVVRILKGGIFCPSPRWLLSAKLGNNKEINNVTVNTNIKPVTQS